MLQRYPNDTQTVPARHARALLRLLPVDTPVEGILRHCKLSMQELEQCPSVDLYRYCKLFVVVSRAAQDSLHGNQAERVRRHSSVSLIQRSMMQAPNLSAAIQTIDSHFLRMAPGNSSTGLERRGDLAIWTFEFGSGPAPDDRPWSIESFSMANLSWFGGILGHALGMWMWHRCASWLIGAFIDLDRVELADPRPASPEHYAPLFAAPIYYGRDRCSLHFSARFLEFPIVRNRTTTEETGEDYLYAWATMHLADTSICTRIKKLIGTDFSRRLPTLETIAGQLNMSVAAVHRHLKKENSSYQQLKDECRHEAALAYLRREDLPIADIAELLGFSDTSTFHRAFKNWSGLTPNQVRQQSI